MEEPHPNYAVVMLVTVVLVLGATLAVAWPRDRFVLVAAAPGSKPQTLMSIIGGAGGTLVGSTRFDWLAVAYSEKPGFAGALLNKGAVLVVDHALAAGCLERN